MDPGVLAWGEDLKVRWRVVLLVLVPMVDVFRR
jgi:hypothetical protein